MIKIKIHESAKAQPNNKSNIDNNIAWVKNNEQVLEKKGFKVAEIGTIGGFYYDKKHAPMIQPVDTMHVIRFFKRGK